MTQWVESLAVKSDNLSLIPRTHTIERKPAPTRCPLTSTHACVHHSPTVKYKRG